jgi:hypothetical protein
MIFRLAAVPEQTVRRYFLQVPALLNLRFPGSRMPFWSTARWSQTIGVLLQAGDSCCMGYWGDSEEEFWKQQS